MRESTPAKVKLKNEFLLCCAGFCAVASVNGCRRVLVSAPGFKHLAVAARAFRPLVHLRNAKVGGSIPFRSTNFPVSFSLFSLGSLSSANLTVPPFCSAASAAWEGQRARSEAPWGGCASHPVASAPAT